MPDDDQLNAGDLPIVIGVDPSVPDGMIVFVTRNADGTVQHAQPVHLPTEQGDRLWVGPVVRGPVGTPEPVNLEQFDVGRFTDVGYTTSDGVVVSYPDEAVQLSQEADVRQRLALHARAVYEARTDTAPAPDGDVLDRIDAAVDGLCACGCRLRVPPDGPSAYFASPGCQRRWHSAQTTDPDEVYGQRDAAQVYVGADHADVPLNEPSGTAAPSVPGHTGEETFNRIVRRAEVPPPCPDPFGAGYRRHCAVCNERVIPRPVRDGPYEVMEWGSEQPVRYLRPDIRLECPRCHGVLPGPALFADVEMDGPHRLLLTLRDGFAGVNRRIDLRQVARCLDPEAYVRLTWEHMERELARFRRAWLGRNLADEHARMARNPAAGLIAGVF